MSFVHAFIIGNLLVAMFNMVAMTITPYPRPPLWAYAIGWPMTVAAVYYIGNFR